MARESISILEDETLLAGYNNKALPGKADLSDVATNRITLQLTVVNGELGAVQGRPIIVMYGFSDEDMQADDAVDVVNSIEAVRCNSRQESEATYAITSDMLEVGGNYLYTWINTPDTLNNDVNVSLVVMPATCDVLCENENEVVSTLLGGTADPNGTVAAAKYAIYQQFRNGTFLRQWVKSSDIDTLTGWQ
jgi:hypothetical protein